MPHAARPIAAPGRAQPVLAVLLLAGWLAGALLVTGSGTLLLEPIAPCRGNSGCNGAAILATEYAVRYGPLLVFLAVLPIAAARVMQHRDALPAIAVGAGAAAVLLTIALLIAATAG